MKDLTAFQRDVLYSIADLDAPKGLEIKEELEEYFGEEVPHSRLYSNLDTLVDKGLVEKGSQDNRTNSYTFTARAVREIEARREWETKYTDVEGVPVLHKSTNQ